MRLIAHLVNLQEVDTAIMEIEELQGDLPSKVEELTATMFQLESAITTAESRLTEIELEIRKMQTLEQERKDKISKLQDQLYLVKTNREYDALMAETDHLKGQLDEEELCELELSEEKDQVSEKLEADKTKNEEMSQQLGTQKKELESRISETEEEHTELIRKREDLAKNIDNPNLALYDRVRAAKEGIAVVPVLNQACGGCHSRIPSQLEADIRSGKQMTQCNTCRRILYWEEAEDPS
ncbi:MAG: C4-type zinc ribbon domain-containing protein [Candidatus Neomarinimicrobiota bacterium]|nr:C4-type zinc ribbon domain-containing protein [Candidatus Neomarinimicrobiota bacterium]